MNRVDDAERVDLVLGVWKGVRFASSIILMLDAGELTARMNSSSSSSIVALDDHGERIAPSLS